MSMVGSIEHLRRKWRLRRERNFRRGVWREIASGARGQLYVDRAGDEGETTFVAGHDRSGTTWIADIINYRKDYRYIFEPFTPGRLELTSAFRPRQYLRPDERDPRYVDPARAIVTGQIRSLWTDKYNRAVWPRKRLVKDVRANLLLPWLCRTFPDMRLVFILRHPCAVAHSQMNVSKNWRADLRLFLDQESLVDDHLRPFLSAIDSARDDFERLIAVWCINNYVPLHALKGANVQVSFYEDFCVAPRGEVATLLTSLGDEADPRAMRTVERPSATTRRDSPVLSGESLVDGWRASVTAEQLDGALRILGQFGLDRIYGRDSLPLTRLPLAALG
jgi:hypothetical protein